MKKYIFYISLDLVGYRIMTAAIISTGIPRKMSVWVKVFTFGMVWDVLENVLY
jgi:hypothetical protein